MINFDFLKNNITKLGILAPLVTSVFGVIIVNLYLNQYGLVEYSIFQTQSILTGSVYIIILYLLFSFFTWILLKFRKSIILMVLVSLICSTLLASVFFYLSTETFATITLFKMTLENEQVKGLIVTSILGIVGSFFLLEYIRQNDVNNKLFNGSKHRIFNVIIVLVLIIISIIIISVLSINLFSSNKVYKDFFWFFMQYSSLIIGGIIGLNKDIKRAEDGKNEGLLSINNAIIYLISFVVFITYQYSTNIYPFFPKNYGGGKPENVKIIYNSGEELKGKLIHSNSNIIFILQDNKSIKIIEWNKLESITTQ